MVVQHNLRAMNSNRMLGLTGNVQAKSTEKLSSGYKINRAADDAAGLSISEKMRKQIRGLTQASLNAQDGISAVQTAEGALNEVQDMLQRMNELAVKAANGTNSSNDRTYIQNEIDQLVTEIDRVAETTKFNETYLLRGDANKKTTVYNYNRTADIVVNVTISSAGVSYDSIQSATLYNVYGTKITSSVALQMLKSGENVYSTSSTGFSTTQLTFGYDATGVKGSSIGGHEVQLVSTNLASLVKAISLATSGAFSVQGDDIKATADNTGVVYKGVTIAGYTLNDLKNNYSTYVKDTTPMTVTITKGTTVPAGMHSHIVYKVAYKTTVDGATKVEQKAIYGTTMYVKLSTNLYDRNKVQVAAKGDIIEVSKFTATMYYTGMEPNQSNQLNPEKDPYFESVAEGGVKFAMTTLYNGDGSVAARKGQELSDEQIDGIQAGRYSHTSITLGQVARQGLLKDIVTVERRLHDSEGNVVVSNQLKDYFGMDKETGKVVYKGGLFDNNGISVGTAGLTLAEDEDLMKFVSAEILNRGTLDLNLHVGADATDNNQIGLGIQVMDSKGLGVNGLRVDGETDWNARNAIDVIQVALQEVSTQRSALGAVQNRLEHTIKNLDNVVENTTAAESQIRDTDMATEMVKFSNNNILAQAGQAMLAQSNQANQGVLSLLG